MSIYKMRTEFGKHLKVILGIVVIIFIVGAVYQFGAAPTSQEANKQEQKVLAVVNNLPISGSEFEAVWYQIADNARNQGVDSTRRLADTRAAVFQQLVDSRLRLSAAEKMGIDVSDKAVKQKRNELVIEYMKANRRQIFGEVSAEREETDPRKDREYARELSSMDPPRSISIIEQQALLAIPESQVRVQLVYEAVRDYYRKKAGPVTDKDIDSSYDAYRGREIMLRSGKVPEEQMLSKADKIVKAARAGKDFAQLVKDNSEGPYAKGGGETEYSMDTYMSALQMASQGYMMIPPELYPAVKKLKPGEISDPIKTDMGIYIIKLERMASNRPQKLDKKARKERRKQLEMVIDVEGQMDFDGKMRKDAKIKVDDKEMAGYYHLGEARKARAEENQELYKKELSLASAALNQATKEQKNNPFAGVKYAEVLEEQGKYNMALEVLYPMLEGRGTPAQGADVRMWCADLFLKVPDEKDIAPGATNKDKALVQYQKASEAAVYDRSVHEALKQKFEQLGRADLAKAEGEWIAEFDKKQEAVNARQEAERKKLEEQKKAPKSDKANE